jgi:hypothetical protein
MPSLVGLDSASLTLTRNLGEHASPGHRRPAYGRSLYAPATVSAQRLAGPGRPGHGSVVSKARIYVFAFKGKDGERAFVYSPQRLSPDEPFEALYPHGKLAER